jgi:hypothetical protein
VLAAAYVQQLHRVRLAEAPEPPTTVAAARNLQALTPPAALTIDDRPIISFLAHRRVVGQLVDLANLRWQTRSLTDAKVIALLPRADAVVVSRALGTRPRVMAAVRRRFRRAYAAGGVQIFERR